MTDDTTIIPFRQAGSVIDPLTEIAQDVVDFIEAQQPSEVGVRVGDLPIVKYPNGALRGVDSFTVQLGKSPSQGGPYVYNSAYPVPQANAEIASVAMTNRQKARAQISNVIVLAV